jgi:RND family efflux transporter MFP subunit
MEGTEALHCPQPPAEVANMRQRLVLLGLSPQSVSALRSSSQISSEVSLPSPVSGTVTSRTVNPGEVIEANKELMRVTDLSSVWVVGQVYEKDLGLIRVGSGASITSDAYPGRVFRGRVSYVDPRLDPATRTAQVRIELANPGQTLKIGMYVGVAFATVGGSESTTPVVPLAAVQNINNQQVVFVATSDANVFAMRPVRLGPESNGFYPVLEGLNVGDRIVTEGSFLLRAEWLKTHPAQ